MGTGFADDIKCSRGSAGCADYERIKFGETALVRFARGPRKRAKRCSEWRMASTRIGAVAVNGREKSGCAEFAVDETPRIPTIRPLRPTGAKIPALVGTGLRDASAVGVFRGWRASEKQPTPKSRCVAGTAWGEVAHAGGGVIEFPV